MPHSAVKVKVGQAIGTMTQTVCFHSYRVVLKNVNYPCLNEGRVMNCSVDGWV